MHQTMPAQVTPFVGRVEDLANIQRLLANESCRLVTLTGLGGSGKTRLAIEFARMVDTTAQQNVVFVSLQPLTRSELIIPTIAQAIGLNFYGDEEPETQLLNYLREKSLLLILDNFEHLLEGVTIVSTMLAHTAGVKILATSREVLNLQEEWVYPLKGMSTPPSFYSTSLEDYEAVQLFLYHARRVQPDFDPEKEHESVIRICQITAGLPLAIELVATWLKGISASQIAREIQHNLDFLSTKARNAEERHRSIRAVFDQSWRLLSEPERLTFAHLSVFQGEFDATAAEKIVGATLNGLSALVEKSLLRTSAGGHFEMHELVRQYAEEHLAAYGRIEATHNAHSMYYTGLLKHLALDLKSGRQREALDTISTHFENIYAAWDWALQTRHIQNLTAAMDGLFMFYELQSRFHEGDELLAHAINMLPDHSSLRSRLLTRRATIKIALGQYDLAQHLLNESLMLAGTVGTDEQLADSLNQLARATCYLGDYGEAERLCQQSFAIYEVLGDTWGRARCWHVLGFIMSRIGNFKTAQEHYRQSVALFRALGDTHFLNASLINLGVMCATLSENIEARHILEESLEIATQIHNRLEIARALDHLGTLLVWGFKDYEGAVSYYERSLALRREIGDLPGVALTLSNIADIAVKVSDYSKAHHLYNEALNLFQRQGDPWHMALILGGLGDVATGLGQYDLALDYFRATFQKSVSIQAKALTLSLLASVIILFAKMERWELATALTALIIHHPDSPPGLKHSARELFLANTGEKTPPLNPLLDNRIKMSAYVNLYLEELTHILMIPHEYFNELASPFVSLKLPEPLTARESEVLRLMGIGLTNAQIAAELMIGPGTVKTHTLNIYRKLEVNNRTQAIVRAQELGLLPA